MYCVPDKFTQYNIVLKYSEIFHVLLVFRKVIATCELRSVRVELVESEVGVWRIYGTVIELNEKLKG